MFVFVFFIYNILPVVKYFTFHVLTENRAGLTI